MNIDSGAGAQSPRGTAPFSVVLFDLDDTLFAHRHAVDTGVAAHIHRLGGSLAAADAAVELARWHDLEEKHYHRYLSGELDYIGQRRARSRAFMEPYGITLKDDRAADAWFDDYLVEYRRAWTLYDDSVPCLVALQAESLRIGIITNGDLGFQSGKVAAAGLTPYVEHVVASGEVGWPKPDARIFERACEAFGVEAEGAIYVGDRLATDALGATSAGLTGIWIDRAGIASTEELARAADAGVTVIRGLDELPALVAARG